MPFSIAIFIASLWGLSSEMIEDAAIDYIYVRIFGLRKFLFSLLSSTLILLVLSVILVFLFRTSLFLFESYASIFSALLIGAIGIYWLIFSVKGDADEEQYPTEGKSLFPLVFVEVFELFLILLPLSIANHLQEAIISGIVAVLFSISLAVVIKKSFEKVIKDRLRMRSLKLFSGIVLIALAIILLLQK